MTGSSVEYSDVTSSNSAHTTAGDKDDFWGLWERYCTNRFARQSLHWMAGNHEDAADALSNSSLKAWQYLTDPTRDVKHVKGALSRLLHNHCMEVWRERKRHAKCLSSLANRLQQDNRVTATAQESVEETLLRHEMTAVIHQALDNLPPRLHEAAVLRFVHELSHNEIAVRLCIRPENVRKRVQQARALLQEQLRSYCSEATDLMEFASGLQPCNRHHQRELQSQRRVTNRQA